MSEDLIAADIRIAKTLPSKFYTDEAKFNTLLSVFEGWQFAAHSSEHQSNSILPLEHIEAIIGEPVVLVKGDETRCLSNICTHRGMRLVSNPCSKTTLQCEYHGRTFDLEGNLKHMPEFEQAIGFPTESDNLHQFEITNWKGLNFVCKKRRAIFMGAIGRKI